MNSNNRVGSLSGVIVIWSMRAAACLTPAFVQLLVRARNRSAWAGPLYALPEVGAAVFAFCENRAHPNDRERIARRLGRTLAPGLP